MKKILIGIIVSAVLIGAGFGIGYFWRKSSEPINQIVESKQAMEVYEEFPVSTVQRIHLELKNENVKVSLSDNKYIRLVYQPSTDGLTFKYALNDGTLSMNVGEVEVSSGIVPNQREMIYLYLPKNSAIDLKIETGSGFIDIDKVSLNSLDAKTQSGLVSLSNSSLKTTSSLNVSNGKIFQHQVSFTDLTITTKASSIYLQLPQKLETMSYSLAASNILLNQQTLEVTTQTITGNILKIDDPNGTISLKEPAETVGG